MDKGKFQFKCNMGCYSVHRLRLLRQALQVLRIDLQRSAVAQGHPGSPVERIGHGIWLLLGVGAQIDALGEILAQQPMGVFVAAPLPRSARATSFKI